MNNLKKSYTDIRADKEFNEKIATLIKRRSAALRVKRVLGSMTAAAASLVLVTAAILNSFPATAYALSDIPVISDIVRVITFGKYEHSEGGYDASIATPKIEGLLDKKLEDRLNREFKDNANALIAAYESDVKELKKEFGDETVHMGVTSDYIIKTDNDSYLALDVYILNVAGSSSTVHSFYTIDKKTHTLLTLKGLFKDGADYVSVLNEYLLKQMKYENEHNGGMYQTEDNEFFEGFKSIKPNQNFYINSDGKLVICFDKYEVAAGAQGSPEFVIPDEVIKDIRK